jgi:glycerate-2-kinase
MLKGGRIARRLQPARVIHLIAIEPGSYRELMHENFWLHTLPDGTTYDTAIDSLQRWGAWDEVPSSVREFLSRRDAALSTVKAEEYEGFGHRIFGSCRVRGRPRSSRLPCARPRAWISALPAG